jgi:hypothetical protein
MAMSGRFLLDTNIVIGLFASDPAVLANLNVANAVAVPVIVLGELRFGARKSGKPAENLARIDEFAKVALIISGDSATAKVLVAKSMFGTELREALISRAEAKELLSHVKASNIVVLDFNGVSELGQAFADEVFRVFAQQHPEIELIPVATNSAVKRMISRAQSHS